LVEAATFEIDPFPSVRDQASKVLQKWSSPK
jgi:hypothetical protein